MGTMFKKVIHLVCSVLGCGCVCACVHIYVHMCTLSVVGNKVGREIGVILEQFLKAILRTLNFIL